MTGKVRVSLRHEAVLRFLARQDHSRSDVAIYHSDEWVLAQRLQPPHVDFAEAQSCVLYLVDLGFVTREKTGVMRRSEITEAGRAYLAEVDAGV